MHPPEVRAQALALVEAGINDCEISRRLDIPRRTILDWRKPPSKRWVRKVITEVCPRCWRPAKPMSFTAGDYSELLALYLGDGSISDQPRTSRIRIVLDVKYPGIVSDVRELLERCFPHNRVDEVPSIGCVHVSMYCSHLPCLLPQHGPGRKHERRIVLEPWQRELVEVAPWPFIRGCIRTDGCAFINRTNVHKHGSYEYLTYDFSNMSTDIVQLFREACVRVGVYTRATRSGRGSWRVRINRRASVALMREHVGLKA